MKLIKDIEEINKTILKDLGYLLHERDSTQFIGRIITLYCPTHEIQIPVGVTVKQYKDFDESIWIADMIRDLKNSCHNLTHKNSNETHNK